MPDLSPAGRAAAPLIPPQRAHTPADARFRVAQRAQRHAALGAGFDTDAQAYETRCRVDRSPHVSTATLRRARAVGVVCAVLFFVPTVLAFVYPNAFLFAPYHQSYERMFAAVLAALSVSLLLSVRDPVRNAGVFAVVGLVAGTLDAATIYSLVVDGADVAHWFFQVPLLGAIAAVLVLTYTRLRQPHPVVVRIVIAAVLVLPLALFAHDLAYRAFVNR